MGVLSSRVHVTWAIAAGSWLGVGNDQVYVETACFEKFPFPASKEKDRSVIRTLGEQLDAHRKARQAEHLSLTLTSIYSVLDKIRSGEQLTDEDKAVHGEGLVSVLKQIHDELDAAVFDAYGWPHDLTDDEILRRLVELNRERAEEEKRGIIRWLRPEFQNPGGTKAPAATQPTLGILEPEPEAEPTVGPAKKQPWPKRITEQTQAVRAALTDHLSGLTAEQLARSFLRARADRVADLLATLTSLGQARAIADGRYVRS